MRWRRRPPAQQLPDDARDAVVRRFSTRSKRARCARREKDRAAAMWRAVPWVKRGILLGFRVGRIIDMSISDGASDIGFAFFDKDTYPPRRLTLAGRRSHRARRLEHPARRVRRGRRRVHAADVHQRRRVRRTRARWSIRTRSSARARRSASACT